MRGICLGNAAVMFLLTCFLFNGRVSTYTPNAVNAYESRTVPGNLDVLGEAASDSTVTVNGGTAERLGNYFRAELAADNTLTAIQQTVTTVATRDEETATVTSQRFLPKTPETFTHDDDGNLTSDGRWDCVWDAENRLVQQTATASSVAAGAKNLKLTCAYDYAGRRINKTVSEWDGSGWMQIYSLNFLYDGWNLVAEVAANGGPTLRSYAWGADLSGGDNAGGIGGLTFIRYPIEGKTLAVASDGQGNTSALYDMEDAGVKATYEYGPFGEPLRVSGPFAEVNSFRFSTKYENPETGWLEYTFRDYIPALGRWASQDPIGEAGGINLYGFVSNDPINAVDPWGLFESHPWLRAVVPGQILWDNALTSFENGNVGTGVGFLGTMLAEQTLAVAMFGQGTTLMQGSRTTTTYCTVTRWQNPASEALETGNWVIKGDKSFWNWAMSGKMNPLRPQYHVPFNQGRTFQVSEFTLRTPRGLEGLKAAPPWNQRLYYP